MTAEEIRNLYHTITGSEIGTREQRFELFINSIKSINYDIYKELNIRTETDYITQYSEKVFEWYRDNDGDLYDNMYQQLKNDKKAYKEMNGYKDVSFRIILGNFDFNYIGKVEL